jgi:outer membrane protein OmpA-like peptidoglycan-associated protein
VTIQHLFLKEVAMKRRHRSSFALVAAAITAVLLAGCAGQPTTVVMEGPAPQQVQTTTVPKGTFLGGASAGEATALAQMVATSNNNTMQAFDRVGGQMNQLQATETQELRNSQEALAKLEQLSLRQGAGEITLFFGEGSAKLDQFQYQRLVNFLDYISREAAGRKVILVSIGSASAVGAAAINRRLSQERAEAPLPVIGQYLVNIPHQMFKVSSVGDMYAPKQAAASVEARYQSVRLIAAYDLAQLPK